MPPHCPPAKEWRDVIRLPIPQDDQDALCHEERDGMEYILVRASEGKAWKKEAVVNVLRALHTDEYNGSIYPENTFPVLVKSDEAREAYLEGKSRYFLSDTGPISFFLLERLNQKEKQKVPHISKTSPGNLKEGGRISGGNVGVGVESDSKLSLFSGASNQKGVEVVVSKKNGGPAEMGTHDWRVVGFLGIAMSSNRLPEFPTAKDGKNFGISSTLYPEVQNPDDSFGPVERPKAPPRAYKHVDTDGLRPVPLDPCVLEEKRKASAASASSSSFSLFPSLFASSSSSSSSPSAEDEKEHSGESPPSDSSETPLLPWEFMASHNVFLFGLPPKATGDKEKDKRACQLHHGVLAVAAQQVLRPFVYRRGHPGFPEWMRETAGFPVGPWMKREWGSDTLRETQTKWPITKVVYVRHTTKAPDGSVKVESADEPLGVVFRALGFEETPVTLRGYHLPVFRRVVALTDEKRVLETDTRGLFNHVRDLFAERGLVGFGRSGEFQAKREVMTGAGGAVGEEKETGVKEPWWKGLLDKVGKEARGLLKRKRDDEAEEYAKTEEGEGDEKEEGCAKPNAKKQKKAKVEGKETGKGKSTPQRPVETRKQVMRRRRHILEKINFSGLPTSCTFHSDKSSRSQRGQNRAKIGKTDEAAYREEKEQFIKRWLEPFFHKGKAVPVVGDGVSIRTSNLPGAGTGLFADRDFEEGDLVSEFAGHLLGFEEAKKLRAAGKAKHIVSLKGGFCLDASSVLKFPQGLGGAHHANDGTRHPVPGKKAPGCNVKQFWKTDANKVTQRVFLIATRAIKKGEEIFTSYSNGFWKELAKQGQQKKQRA
uniref:SET domain-containing protein n=1 Tax=Chromera velia CCMP2878 TaxID=1169474 RepID=A0A0G4FTN2_9ALVE|eukprot:Cvel_3750.t1-p1 / transcript=Cvel_3750.t1 / gene=Cvel_3750 / organism=Chromera_velia_CCMP2878 / gene_product=hypothetical protein / transcript_product=hypothetical protein / location=Cvel_scaffold156:107545-114112(-) / protein_length=823 / sequence_SO=supercontig / SO=protein_coding / is_pseudo=false